MKTYLLHHPKVVEAQKPAVAAQTEPAVAAGGPALLIEFDMHDDSIAVSLAPSASSEVRRYGIRMVSVAEIMFAV